MRPRAWVVSALVLVALGVPLGFVWVSGSAAAEAEAARIRAAPREAARAAAERVAARVASELSALSEREGARPYYQWQGLMVDPRGAYEGEAVVPSPLSEGPTEPLVLAHFQLDAEGRVTSPEVSDVEGAPDAKAGAVERLSELRAALAGRRAVPELAAVAPPAIAPAPDEPQQAGPDEPIQTASGKAPVRVQRLSQKVFEQNVQAPEVFEEIKGNKRGKPKLEAPTSAAAPEVEVRIGPFEWEVLALGDAEVIAATRAVETSDRAWRQGFVVDPRRLAALLEDGALRARLARLGGRPSAGARGHGGAGSPDGGEASVEVPLMLPGVARAVVVEAADDGAEALAEGELAAFRVRSALLTGLGAVAACAILLLVWQTERLLERRQRFAAAAAHELRTPLAGLRMYAEMLAHGLGRPEKQKAYAERLASEAARLGRVVANVLDFTRLERRSLSVSPVSQDLSAAVAELVKRLEPSLAEAGVTLRLERPAAPVMATFDGDALAQIVGNLVDNADKYTRAASDRTIIVAVRDDPPQVRVIDRGPGLPQGVRLFEPFARGAVKDGPAGLGLGLALARALARAQGGDLVAGPRGAGAELVLELPR